MPGRLWRRTTWRRAEARARQVLLLNPHNISARALLIEIGLARTGISGGMAAYDEWTGGRVEEPAAVRRLAQAFLHEVAFGPESLYSLDALGVLADLGDDKAVRRMKTAAETAGLTEVRMAAARGNEDAVTPVGGGGWPGPAGPAAGASGAWREQECDGDPGHSGTSDRPRPPRCVVPRWRPWEKPGARPWSPTWCPFCPIRACTFRSRRLPRCTRWGIRAETRCSTGWLSRTTLVTGARPAQAMAVRPGAGWQTLVATLASDPDAEIRLSAARMMAQFDPDQARRVAETLAGSSDAFVRAEATRLLIRDMTQDLKTLRMSLLDTDKTVAIAAARAILMVGR
jgi:hypothetical protein